MGCVLMGAEPTVDLSRFWYPETPDHPPRSVHVRVIWEGRTFQAARILHEGRVRWCEVRGTGARAQLHLLPETFSPSSWQPQHPDRWRAPLPLPVVACEPQMWSATMKFAAVDEAEAAELAREMERDRESARNVHQEARESRRETQWWRDATRISYEPAGSVAPRMAEGRMMRAVCYDRLIKMDMRPYRTNAAVMADLKRGFEALIGDPTHDWRPPFEPVGRDFQDYLTVMGWLADAGWAKPARDVVRWRAMDPPLSFAEIGDHIHKTGEGARHILARFVGRVTAGANARHSPRIDGIEALRERNRAHKRATA